MVGGGKSGSARPPIDGSFQVSPSLVICRPALSPAAGVLAAWARRSDGGGPPARAPQAAPVTVRRKSIDRYSKSSVAFLGLYATRERGC